MESAGSWTEERVELLKKLWLEGLSASQIAGVLGDPSAIVTIAGTTARDERRRGVGEAAGRHREPRSIQDGQPARLGGRGRGAGGGDRGGDVDVAVVVVETTV